MGCSINNSPGVPCSCETEVCAGCSGDSQTERETGAVFDSISLGRSYDSSGSPFSCDLSVYPHSLSTAPATIPTAGDNFWDACYLSIGSDGAGGPDNLDYTDSQVISSADACDGLTIVYKQQVLLGVYVFGPGEYSGPFSSPASGDSRMVAQVRVRSWYYFTLFPSTLYDDYETILEGYIDQATPFDCLDPTTDYIITLSDPYSDSDNDKHWLDFRGATVEIIQ